MQKYFTLSGVLIGVCVAVMAGMSIFFLARLGPAFSALVLGLLGGLVLIVLAKEEAALSRLDPPDDLPPFEGDRSPLVPRPPLMSASARERWPED